MQHTDPAQDWLPPDALGGRTALVTGAASGIGAAVAEALASAGAAVAMLDIDTDGLERTAHDIGRYGHTTHTVVHDLADVDGLAGTVHGVEAQIGPIDILVNDAAIVRSADIMTSDLETFERIMRVNVTAPWRLIQVLGERWLLDRTGGSVVSVSSSSAFRAVRNGGVYGISKTAINALTRSMAGVLGPAGVNVNAVAPGATASEHLLERYGGRDQLGPITIGNLLGRISEPEDVANVIVFLCLPASRQITGQVIHTSAGAVVCAG